MRTLRHEALDHYIFLSVDHVRRVVTEHVRYYNRARPSQAIHGIPDPCPKLRQPPPATGTLSGWTEFSACGYIPGGSSRRRWHALTPSGEVTYLAPW